MTSYGPHNRQTLWASGNPGSRWLVVIHGGLWRDKRITDLTGVPIAKKMAKSFAGVASIDYRLSPEIAHPVHLDDCLAAVNALTAEYRPSSLVLLGHSAGCYLAGQVAPKLNQVTPVEHIIGLEGIYDIPDLIAEYPTLKPLIDEAFPGPYDRPDWQALKLTVVHSREDELLSMRQPELALRLNPMAKFVEVKGKHDEIFDNALVPEDLCAI